MYDDGGTRPDGTLLWTYMTGREVRSCPAVVDGVVYFGSNDHTLSALDADTGGFLWNATTGLGVQSSPAVAGGFVYAGSWDGSLYAFNATDGSQGWNYTTGDGVISSPVVAGGLVYTGSNDGTVYALDAETGEPAWEFITGGERVISSPAVAGGVVYIGSGSGDLYALDAVNGTVLWNYTTNGPVHSSPAIAGGVVYFGSDDGNIYALSASGGSLLWNSTTGGAVRSSPAVADGVVYVGSDDGRLYALDAVNGTSLWSYEAGGEIYASPAVADGVIYCGSLGFWNNFFALDAATGALLWDYTFEEHSVYGSPAVSGGIVYVGCDDGGLHAFGSSQEEPPAGVTGLNATAVTKDSLTWAWTDPSTPTFSHVIVYLDGVFRQNVTAGTGTWKATGLLPGTPHTIATRTASAGGLVNQTWVNHTAWTEPEAGPGAWKFRSDNSNSGLYDDGGTTPGGELLWEYNTEGYYLSSPAVVNGVLYVNSIYDLLALDALTGKLLWASPYGGGRSSPAVTGGVVYTGSNLWNVYALDASTGDLIWNYSTGGTIYSSPAVADGILFIGSNDRTLYALDAGTGTLLWSYPAGGEIRSSPAVANGMVCVASGDGTIHALNASTGTLLWNVTTGREILYSSPVIAGGTVYARSSDGDSNGYLDAIDALTGTRIWTCPLHGYSDFGIAVYGGTLFTPGDGGNLSAIDAATGTFLWNYATGGSSPGTPSVANGIVYTGGTDGYLYALDAGTGTLLWRYKTNETSFSGPVIANGVVYAQGDKGTLYALAALPEDPPGSVTDLRVTSSNGAEITWAWTDPRELGFSHVMVFLDGVFQGNVSAGTETWTARGLAPSTSYTIGTRTVGKKGAVNSTMVTHTATTGTISIASLDPAGVVEDSPPFVLNVYGTGFTPVSTILWDGEEQVTQYLQPDHVSMQVPGEYAAHPRRVTLSIHDTSSGESSNEVVFSITDIPAAKARKFRSDLRNSGVYDDGGRRPVPSLLWTYRTGGRVTSSPSIVDGVVYIGSQDRNLYALNATTGECLWKYDTLERNDFVTSSPAVANGVVYIGGMKTKIHAIDAYSGSLLWKRAFPIRSTTRSGISSSPAVAGGVVSIGNMDGAVYAFDEETGNLLWSFSPPGNEDRDEIFSSPAVAGGIVYIQSYSGIVYALNASTGAILWTHGDGRDSAVYSSPAVRDGAVYVGGGTKKTFSALDAHTGDVIWNFSTPGTIASSPAIADGTVYFGCNDNNVYALDAANGTLLWNFTTGDRVWSSPAVAGGVVYVGSFDKTIYALDAPTGGLLWSFPVGDSVMSSPAVADGILYVGCSDGNVYALGTLPLEPPVADFSANVTAGKAPLHVGFSDTSTGIVTWRLWDFGDGTKAWANGTAMVNHTYLSPGTFTVSLTAGNSDGHDSREKPAYIQVTPAGQKPVAWFSATPMMGYRPLQVRFTDRSMGSPTAWRWDFGDGNTSTEKNPVHTYTAAGTFRVTLTAFNAGGSSSSSSTVWVRERAPIPTITPTPTYSPHPTISPRPTIPPRPGTPPISFFKMNPIMGRAPLTVTFTDMSFNAPTAWSWDFGDGNTSALENPVHTFENPGIYAVSLKVENAFGNSSTSRTVYVR